MNDPWNDARSYEDSECIEDMTGDGRVAQRMVKALCLGIAAFCFVYFGGQLLIAAVS